MQIEFTPEAMNNLKLFLDRVPLKGHRERYAMNEIEHCLMRPIQEPKKQEAPEK